MTSPRLLLPSVNSHGCDELCVGHQATRSEANHVLSPKRGELHASDNAWYIFPLFPSGGGPRREPGRLSRANRIALGAEWGGTEARKGCPNWSVRNILDTGG